MGCDGMGAGNKQAEKSVRLRSEMAPVSLFSPGIVGSRCMCECMCVCVCAQSLSHSDSLQPHGLQPTRLLCPWDFPGKNTGWVPKPSSRASFQPRD